MIQRATRPTAGIVPVAPSIYERTSYCPQAQASALPAIFAEREAPSEPLLERREMTLRRRYRAPELHLDEPGHGQRPRPPEPANALNAMPQPVAADSFLPPALERSEPIVPVQESNGPRGAQRHLEPANPVPATPRAAAVPLAEPTAPQPPSTRSQHLPGAEPPLARPRAPHAAAGPRQPVEVHVSIGHIEIRQAAPPPLPPPPRPAPVPHMRLEDYLRRRSGEAR
jgi:hypothetical protein